MVRAIVRRVRSPSHARSTQHADQPPSYDAATTAGGPSPRFADAALPVAGPSTALGAGDKKAPLLGANDKKAPASPPRSPLPLAAPSFPMPMPAPLMSPGGTRVYRYQHPVTGDVITSLLPPDHPQMVCLQEGRHMGSTSFGLIGAWISRCYAMCVLMLSYRRAGGRVLVPAWPLVLGR
jgi:hypothetical protein